MFIEQPKNTFLIYVSYTARKLIRQIIIFIYTLRHDTNAISEWVRDILGIENHPMHLIYP